MNYEANFLSSSQTNYCASLTTQNYFYKSFPIGTSVPGCQTCMCK